MAGKSGVCEPFSSYSVMVVMHLSSYVISVTGGREVGWFGLFTLPSLLGKNEWLHEVTEGSHEVMATVILVLVSIHLLAASGIT